MFKRKHGEEEQQAKRARLFDAPEWEGQWRGEPSAMGTHGFREYEQDRLGTSGDTHQSEHPIGYEVIRRHLGLSGPQARSGTGLQGQLERRAPAYQEVKAYHRAHVGTGTSTRRQHPSDMNSQTYRNAQLELLMPSPTSRTGR